jgi:hypothetical protein
MIVKNLHQFFYYHNKYLNDMKYQEISMDHLFAQFSVECYGLLTPKGLNVHTADKPVLVSVT